jgi:hypothetical protein
LKLSFLTIGDKNFFPYISFSIYQLNKLYLFPTIVVYDVGFTNVQKKRLKKNDNVIIIDWLNLKKSFPISINPISFLKRRLYGSKLLDYRRECLLAQKPYIFKHWNKINPHSGFIFLDGDAIIIKKFDTEPFFNKITFTIRQNEELNFNKRSCAVINSGVIFFCDKRTINDKILDKWCKRMYKTNEKLVEQSALTRLLVDQVGNEGCFYRSDYPILQEGLDFTFNLQCCIDYNYYWLDETDKFLEAKIIHFKKSRRTQTFLNTVIQKIDSNYISN